MSRIHPLQILLDEHNLIEQALRSGIGSAVVKHRPGGELDRLFGTADAHCTECAAYVVT